MDLRGRCRVHDMIGKEKMGFGGRAGRATTLGTRMCEKVPRGVYVET